MRKSILLSTALAAVMFFQVVGQAEAATKILYESDFSTNPAWATDQPENFYWDASEQALYLHAEIRPAGSPSRYFITDVDLDTEQSFSLTYDWKILDSAIYSIFQFGLFSPDLLGTNIRVFGNRKYAESTLNFSVTESVTRYNSTSYSRRFNITTGNGTNYGVGGSGSSFQQRRNTWYQTNLSYDAENSIATVSVIELTNGTIVYSSERVVPNSFSENMKKLGFSINPEGEYGTVSYDSARLNGAGIFLLDNVKLVQETEEEPEPPLSDLLLQYEPILQFHEDEDYYPINVDAFVEGSGLWDSSFIDELLIPYGENNILTLDYLATTTDTSKWYVAFSTDEKGTIDLLAAKNRYDQLVLDGEAVPTYYAYEGEDSYVDDFGNIHEFIVLQYWYFYAMNNWREQGGFNDHEGDWESIFVFLDKETQEPKHVAFSSHHNDGVSEFYNPLQYESVRRNWLDTNRTGSQITSYVAAGSHANYDNSISRSVLTLEGLREDSLSSAGITYGTNSWTERKSISQNMNDWMTAYSGLFGAERAVAGGDGTQGPLFTKVSGRLRFAEPVFWAGLDKVAETKLTKKEQVFDLAAQGVSFIFDKPLEIGTYLGSALHEEFISFGNNVSEYELLPRFWDFTTSLPNESFSVEVTLTYSEEEITTLDLDENSLRAFYYNATEHIWMVLPSTVDTTRNEVQFETDHFSIYTIGAVPKELLNLDVTYKANWRTRHSQKEDSRVATVSFLNETDRTLTESLAITIDASSDSIHASIDGTDREFGNYQDILVTDYGTCLYSGTESSVLPSLPQNIKQQLLKNKNLNCSRLLEAYPELSQSLTYGLLPGEFSLPITIEFYPTKKNNKSHPAVFDFVLNLLK